MSIGGGPEAFTFVIVSHDLPDKVESLCPYKDRVYVGLSDGSLIVLEPEFELHEDGPWSIEKRVKGFAKRGILQMEPAPSLPAMFTLSSGGLQLNSLPDLNLITHLPCSGVPYRFAWNDRQSLMAVALRRSVVFYKREGTSFIETNSVLIPDTIKLMAWCKNRLCYGTRTRYVFIDPESGQLTESILVGRGNTTLTPLMNDEILLTRDNCGMYIKPNGQPARNVNITWSQSPLAVVLCEPFVVGLMENFMEVRNISPTARQCVIQMFNDVDRINVASNFLGVDGSVFLASRERKTVGRLNPVPLRQQIDALITMKEFQDALQVTDLLEGDEQIETEDDIRVSYGVHLFMNKEYNEGLMQLMMRSHRTPVLLLKHPLLNLKAFDCGSRLFPSLVSKEMLESFTLPVSENYFDGYQEPEGEDYEFAVSCLLPLLLADRTRLKSRRLDDLEADQRAFESIQEDTPLVSESAPSVPRSQAMRSSSSLNSSRVRRTRLAELVDTAIMKAMLVCPDSGALLQFVRNENDINLDEGERSLKATGRYIELSALYQSHGMHDIGLEVLRLLSLEPEKLEHPPRGASSDLRGVTGVWAAVQYLSKLTKADAEVIQKHSGWVLKQDPEAALEVFVGAEKRLPPSVVLPILAEHVPQYSAVYLEAILDKGDVSREEYDITLVNIYLKEAIANEKKLGHLHRLAVRTKRFDFALMNEKSTKRLLQKDSVFVGSTEMLYEDVARTIERPEFSVSFDPPTALESYTRLRELIIESPNINPQSVLESIPSDTLLELQALLHERQRNYLSALAIYIQRLQDLDLAEQLCDRVYEQEDTSMRRLEVSYSFDFSEQTENLYMDMIRIYLTPEGTVGREVRVLTDDEWRELCSLLCRKRYRINIEEMFDLLPGDVDLSVLMQFIDGALRTLAEQQRNLLIVHSLYTSDNLFRKEQLIRCHQRTVPVTYESACCFCRKRIGNAVFVAYPDDALAHIACYTRRNKTEMSSFATRMSSGVVREWE